MAPGSFPLSLNAGSGQALAGDARPKAADQGIIAGRRVPVPALPTARRDRRAAGPAKIQVTIRRS
jgi:hypothetical protein